MRGLVVLVLSILWAIVLVLTGGRFLALLLDANRDSEIIDRLYRHSELWVEPFFGLFNLTNEAVEESGGVFEPASLIAFVVYLLIGALVLALINRVFGWPTGRHYAEHT